MKLFAGLLAGLMLALPAVAGRLDRAVAERLDNGLAVLVLEDPTLPVVSTQVLYKVGGRDEHPGATGLAHFVEHMAFRATERFPGTDVVGRIYGAGGEWHGYTWIDQTTFFETVPKAQLPLALDIQADRMARLLLPRGELEAERGSVLTELRGYENDPASRLYDAVAAAAFLQHPYRHNTIGWESDVLGITHEEVAAFYRRHYHPGNAVLAIAGDVRAADALALARRAFGAIPAGEPVAPPRTVEPPQQGVRRVEIPGDGDGRTFQVSYRAPAAADPDFPAFLLLQALLTGSPGCNFWQDGDAFPARPGSRLHGVADEIASLLVPSAQPYLFSVSGRTGREPAEIEAAIEERIAALREGPIPPDEFERARQRLLTELELDVETPEDAAHQMAFFEGIGAFAVLKRLPDLVAAVTPEDVRRVAAARLQPYQRTIGWTGPVPPPGASRSETSSAFGTPPPLPSPAMREREPGPPRVKVLRNGITLIARRVPRVSAGFLRAVVPGDSLSFAGEVDVAVDEPSWRHTSLGLRFRAGELAQAIRELRRTLQSPTPCEPEEDDPESRLDSALREALGIARVPFAPGPAVPVVVVAVGDLEETRALREMEAAFSTLPRPHPLPKLAPRVRSPRASVALPGKAQSRIGYAVPAGSAPAWRMLLYVLSHGYEGRLGKELIARRGLLYHIDSRVHSDGRNAWISLATGVNPDRLDEAEPLFVGMIRALRGQPPTAEEIEEARRHLIGRRVTAPMSNEEMSAAYAQELVERGRLLMDREWEREVRAVTREEVLGLIPGFLAGAAAVVDVRSR